MFFLEALEALKAGKSMCRASWTIESGYLKIMDGMDFVWKIVLLPNPNAGNYIFSVEDFLAEDWKEFEVPKKAIEAEVELSVAA
jgi:hypothetical protein